jgi:stage II sporulation SpoAA-like protein
MIELLPDMPKGVTGIRVSGRLQGTVLTHHWAFRRIAVGSDKEWVAPTLHALTWMVPGELAVFGLDELDRAKQWAAG